VSVREGANREVLVWCVGVRGYKGKYTCTVIADTEDARLIHVCSDYMYTYMCTVFMCTLTKQLCVALTCTVKICTRMCVQ